MALPAAASYAAGSVQAPIPLGPFELLSAVATGGMARVWRGRHRATGIAVAVKVLEGAYAFDRVFQDAFAAEVRAVAGLDHPSVVLVFDHGRIPPEVEAASGRALKTDAPYLVMEYASGGTLLEHPPVTWSEAREVLVSLLDALAHAHARGVVHRDIKGGNVLRCAAEDLRPGWKLSDFGLALPVGGDDVTDVFGDVPVGTPPYMAPEQFAGDPRDFGPWTDLYALGCVGWLLTTGSTPFGGGTSGRFAELHEHAPVPAWGPRIAAPKEVESWLRRLLEKDPADRFACAADAARALALMPGGDDQAQRPLRVALPSPPTDPAMTTVVARRPPGGPAAPRAGGGARPAELPAPFPRSWRGPASGREGVRLQGAGLGLLALRRSALVGREGERDRLWVALERVASGRGTEVVLLSGEPGQGKSALAAWLGARAAELGVATPLRASFGGAPGPGHGTAALLARWAGLQGLSGGPAARRLAARLRAVGADLRDLPILLATVFGPDAPGSRRAPPGERHAALGRLLDAEAARRPVVLWIDDAHADPEAVPLMQHLLDRGRVAGRVLVVATARSAGAAREPGLQRLLEDRGAQELRLLPLSPAEERQLLGSLLSLDPALADAVRDRAEGNPLFALQLLGDLAERGVLAAGEQGFLLAAGATASLPADIHALWQRRVERALAPLGAGAAAGLELAAALGETVARHELADAAGRAGLPDPTELEPALFDGGLAAAEPDGWSFSHGLLRESVRRASQEAGRWAGWNAACADAIEGLDEGPPALRAERIGRHRVHAGQWEAALSPLLTAARERVRGDDCAAGLRLLDLADRAVAAAALPDSDRRVGLTLAARADAHLTVGDLPPALAAADRLVRLARAQGWPELEARGLLVLGQNHLREYRPDDARLFFEPALARLSGTDDAEGTERALRLLARALGLDGELETARLHAGRALESARRSGDPSRVGEALQVLAALHRHAGEAEAAEATTREATDAFEASGHLVLVGDGYATLAEARRERGDLDEARRWFEAAWRLWERVGSRHALMGLLCVAGVDLERGDADAALALVDEAFARVDPGSYYESVCWILRLQGVAVGDRWDTLPQILDRLEELARQRMLSNPEIPEVLALVRERAEATGRGEEARRLRALEGLAGRLGRGGG
jgi:tetratricopeptide (TPR) repeat protein